MFYIARKEFPDRLLDETDLDAVADLWWAWQEEKRSRAVRSPLSTYQFLEARLWGFARDRGASLAEVLSKRLDCSLLPGSKVVFLDPDTIAIGSPTVAASERMPRGLWLDLFRGQAFSGLPLMLRLSIAEFRGTTDGPPVDNVGLVLVGLLQNDCMQLKAVWPGSTSEQRIESLFRLTVWPKEKAFLKALDDLQASGRLPSADADFFVTQRRQRATYRLLRLLVDLPGEAKLPAFLWRVGFFLCLIVLAVLGSLYPRVNWQEPFIAELTGALGAIGLAGLGFNLWRKARTVCRNYSRMKALLTKLYSQPISFPPVDLASLGLADDAAIVKYTRELELAGARRLTDFRIEPTSSGRTYVRLFQLPADHTYVFFNVMLATRISRHFPASPYLAVSTFFSDGSRLVTTNSQANVYRKPRKTNVIRRVFSSVQDPAEFLARHRRILSGLLAEGRRLAPLMSAASLIRRRIEEHEEDCELSKQHGYYTWGDAIRQAFGIARREYVDNADTAS